MADTAHFHAAAAVTARIVELTDKEVVEMDDGFVLLPRSYYDALRSSLVDFGVMLEDMAEALEEAKAR